MCVSNMCFKIVFMLFCVFQSVLCCSELDDPMKLFYRDGDILDLEITYMTRDPYFPVFNSKSFEFNGQVCNTSNFLPLSVTHMTVDNRFWKFMTIYEKIDKEQNICSYYTSVLEPNTYRQMQLIELVHDDNRTVSDNPTPKTFHYKIIVDCVKFCFDVQETIEIADRVSEPEPVVIEGEVGSEVEHVCTPERENRPSMIQFLNNNSAIIAAFADRTSTPKHLKFKLQDFDNNTYISCASRPATTEFPKAKWATIKVKPRAVDADTTPSDIKIYKYRENETYDFECSNRDYVIFIMKLNEHNEILSSVSSNEYTNNLIKSLKLTKNYHNLRLVCLAFHCESNRTAKYYACVRQQINAVKFEMKNDSDVDKNIVPSDKCQLPAYPPNGRYQVINTANANPFQISDFWILDIVCDLGYGILDGENRVHCSSGVWSRKLPECIPFCKLKRHESVNYNCRMGDNGTVFTRACNDYEPPGMVAVAECKTPEYISNDELPIMRCSPEGVWSDYPTCSRACGEYTPRGVVLINNGEYANLGELPWHVGIYQKTSKPYKQICGGSIVRPNVVISAAHCFWKDNLPADQKLRPACDYAVAAGKLYRPWDDPVDNKYAQKVNVKSIKVPNRFHGASNSFMDDLAVVVLCKPLEYKPHIAPVCLSFDEHFDRVQVAQGVIGKVTGWGVTSPGGSLSPELRVVDLPIVPYLECYNTSPLNFKRFITKDKICAGFKDKGTGVCTGDSGGGLVVAGNDQGVTRYYLRGIVSAAPDELISCMANEVTAFTHVTKHHGFIKPYLV